MASRDLDARDYKPDWINVFMVLGLFLLILVAAIALIIIRSDGSQCLANPIQYGADAIARNEGQSVTVTVSSFGKESAQYVGEYPAES